MHGTECLVRHFKLQAYSQRTIYGRSLHRSALRNWKTMARLGVCSARIQLLQLLFENRLHRLFVSNGPILPLLSDMLSRLVDGAGGCFCSASSAGSVSLS